MRSQIEKVIHTLKTSSVVMFKDLSLLASLYVAYFIVWRTLRRRRRERATRREQMMLIPGGLQAASLEPRKVTLTGFSEGRFLRDELPDDDLVTTPVRLSLKK